MRFEVENNFGNLCYIDDIEVRNIVVSTDEIAENNTKVELFPNPTNGPINVKWSAELGADEAILRDASGKALKRFPLTSKDRFQNLLVTDCPAGFYTVVFQQRGQVVAIKKLLVLPKP